MTWYWIYCLLDLTAFTEAGIDEEIFKEIDDEMLQSLFNESQCGYRKNFLKRWENWKCNGFQNDAVSADSALDLDPNSSMNTSDVSLIMNAPIDISDVVIVEGGEVHTNPNENTGMLISFYFITF